MKFIHLSDLHLGKRLNEYSLLDDQRYILNAITDILDAEKPDAVLIAGDVYDKSVPPAEAVQLFDDFLVRLADKTPHTFVISGNHDSPERVSFGSRLMDGSGIHLSRVYNGTLSPVTLCDGFGAVDVYMLPFLKPGHVRRFYPEEEIESYTDAVRCALSHRSGGTAKRSVLVTHQFVTGASRSQSEEISVGGTDNVDAAVFAGFDYVALGHLHTPQNCGERIRYCGTPLKYSFSEARDVKSVTVAELDSGGFAGIRTVPLMPLHDMTELRGRYAELTARSFYLGTSWQEDYTHITLTDEEDVPDAIGKLRGIYHGLMRLDYDNARTRAGDSAAASAGSEHRSATELFSDFFEMQNGRPMSAEQAAYMAKLMEKLGEGEI